MRSLIVSLACFSLLAGCATTPNDMKKKQPDLTLVSANAVKVVAACLADTWDKSSGNVPATMRETSSGYLVTATCGAGYPCLVADVSASPNGSKTTTYTQGFGSEDFNNYAKACQ